MKALIDTCVIVDVLQNRKPFAEQSRSVFLLSANKKCDCFITAKSITDIYYLTHRQTHDLEKTRNILEKICELFSMLDIQSSDVINALASSISDFEDAVMEQTAIRSEIDCIVTRNLKDCKNAKLPVYEPYAFVKMVSGEETKIY